VLPLRPTAQQQSTDGQSTSEREGGAGATDVQVRGVGLPAALPPEIAAKILPNTVTGCWAWIGARDNRGHGNVKVAGRVRKAHRVVYELLRGPVPGGYECDHLCRVPWCSTRPTSRSSRTLRTSAAVRPGGFRAPANATSGGALGATATPTPTFTRAQVGGGAGSALVTASVRPLGFAPRAVI